MQATDTMLILRQARIAVASGLLICALGCRQVDTFAPSGASLTVDRPSRLPVVAAETSSAPVVEVCRFLDEPGGPASPYAKGIGNEGVGDGSIAPYAEPLGAPSGGLPRDGDFSRPLEITSGNVYGSVQPSRDFAQGPWAMDRLCDGECNSLTQEFGDASKGLAELAIESSGPPASPSPPYGVSGDRGFKMWLGGEVTTTCDNVLHDYSNYYTGSTLGEFVVILAPAAVFANSDWDADVGVWYQEHIRSVDTNRVSNFIRPLGAGFITIPIYVSAKFVGEYFDDLPGMALLGEFGDRTCRALAVGAPPFLALQYATGGGRPSDYLDESYWRPFRGSHGASGHAFMAAVPFLTLAGMTDDPLAKCFFYACSPWTGFTRINDNVHYLSQVWLGWWMAYLATDAVNKTEKGKSPVALTPICTPEMTGVGLVLQR